MVWNSLKHLHSSANSASTIYVIRSANVWTTFGIRHDTEQPITADYRLIVKPGPGSEVEFQSGTFRHPLQISTSEYMPTMSRSRSPED